VLHALRSGALSRAAAVAVVLVLSGAAGLAGALAPEPPHRCACRTRKGADHRCSCPACARSARKAAERAERERLPPCHRDAALRARAEDQRRERERAVREGARSCLREDCDRGDDATAGPRTLDAFALPATPGLPAPPPPHTTPAPSRPRTGLAPQPETPPPRA
jgi:hypothetical protein